MIQIENVDISGWEAAIRGMRNPMNSWEKSDSNFVDVFDDFTSFKSSIQNGVDPKSGYPIFFYFIGKKDLELMTKLAKAGSEHAKYRRMITVTVDILAPLYWWKEFDTYKVGTVANSCSTMHKIADKEFTLDDFSYEHLLDSSFESMPDDEDDYADECGLYISEMAHDEETKCNLIDNYEETDFFMRPKDILKATIKMLNVCRNTYLETKDKTYWWQMIQLLPSSYNQRRTVMLNYEVLANIYHQRKDHKLDEWRDFCKWIESLPYSLEIIMAKRGE